MAFSGAWRIGAYLQPDQAVTHVADPAHNETGPDEGPNTFTYAAPAQDDLGGSAEYPGLEWVVSTLGRVLDTTDYNSHEADQIDRGADVQGVYGEPATQFETERYSTSRFEGLPATNINPVALQRGRNGLDVNNPDGFRLGWVEQNWVDRKFPVAMAREHDHRVVFPDTATFTADTPPVAAGLYPGVMSSLARAVKSVNQTPTARREPPPMMGDMVEDGSPYSTATVDSWVVG